MLYATLNTCEQHQLRRLGTCPGAVVRDGDASSPVESAAAFGEWVEMKTDRGVEPDNAALRGILGRGETCGEHRSHARVPAGANVDSQPCDGAGDVGGDGLEAGFPLGRRRDRTGIV